MPPLVHVALAQLSPRKGEYAANLARLRDLFERVERLTPRPDVLQLPETALSGYFVEGAVREIALTAGAFAADLDRTYRAARPASAANGARTLDIVIGFYERWRDTLHNSALYVTVGGADGPVIRHVHRKLFLPTYGLFDEERFVERGYEVRAFDTPWGRTALLVCEDAWHSLTGTLAALDGAQVIFICSAAPARGAWPRDDGVPGPATVARWERLVRDIAEEHGVFVTFANLVGSEGGKFFGGASSVAGPAGDVRLRGPLFEEALLGVTLDLGDVARARADMPLLADLRTALPHLRAGMDRIEQGVDGDGARSEPAFDPAAPAAPAPPPCVGSAYRAPPAAPRRSPLTPSW